MLGAGTAAMTANASPDPSSAGAARPGGLDSPPEPEQPVTDMSEGQLRRYRLALLRALRRCQKDAPRYGRASAGLADVMAERKSPEPAADRAEVTTTGKEGWTRRTVRSACLAVLSPGRARSVPHEQIG
jgi:hypothetical protein